MGKTSTGLTSANAATGTSNFMSQYGGTAATNPYYLPTTTDTTNLVQTSQPDVASMVNSAMQGLLGRFATPAEIAMYGKELLAAEKANTGSFQGQTTYAISGKRNTVTGTTTSAGVDPAAFIQNLIQGTGEAKQYRVAGTFMQALSTMADKYKGSFNG